MLILCRNLTRRHLSSLTWVGKRNIVRLLSEVITRIQHVVWSLHGNRAVSHLRLEEQFPSRDEARQGEAVKAAHHGKQLAQSTLSDDNAQLMERLRRLRSTWQPSQRCFQVDGNRPLAEVQDKVCASLTSHLSSILRF